MSGETITLHWQWNGATKRAPQGRYFSTISKTNLTMNPLYVYHYSIFHRDKNEWHQISHIWTKPSILQPPYKQEIVTRMQSTSDSDNHNYSSSQQLNTNALLPTPSVPS